MRLIDADALNASLLRWDGSETKYCYPCREILTTIDAQPTIDAVPVIRCKDCKNFVDEEDQSYCIDMAGQCDGNGFCAWAERKEE